MTGAGGVVVLILLEWSTGWIGVATWTQSWGVVTRGHFRIGAWAASFLALLGTFALMRDEVPGSAATWASAFIALALAYALVQYIPADRPAVVCGTAAALCGMGSLAYLAGLVAGWPHVLAAFGLVAGAVFLGAVTNGMMLGHWYLNQPGLKTWALARLTTLGLAASALAGASGLMAQGRLRGAATTGATLGLPGAGESFGSAFFLIWGALVIFTGAVVLMARRCVTIRSIQSATGLYYVAILTAGVAEFLVRYLMLNAR